jgi:tetratricopeptide (TPR) repeat protein
MFGSADTPASSKVRLDSPAFTALAAKAQAAREAGNPDEALRLYLQALDLKPTWAEGWWFTGTIYYEADHYEQGRDAFRHVLSNEPKMATGWAMLGLWGLQRCASRCCLRNYPPLSANW